MSRMDQVNHVTSLFQILRAQLLAWLKIEFLKRRKKIFSIINLSVIIVICKMMKITILCCLYFLQKVLVYLAKVIKRLIYTAKCISARCHIDSGEPRNRPVYCIHTACSYSYCGILCRYGCIYFSIYNCFLSIHSLNIFFYILSIYI